jgi:hypothetical protein
MTESPLSLAWSPLVPWPVLVVLAGAAVAVLALAAWRRARGLAWRLLAVGALAAALANPARASRSATAPLRRSEPWTM